LNELTEAGFSVEAGYAFNETVPELAVISQSPAGGTTANKGGKVTILISKGPRYTVIPKTVITMDAITAQQMLESLGLKVKVVSIGNNKKKVVKKVSPAVNTKVKRGSTVAITVG
jgi:beta-lactam-binding protein with PASTA domain